MDGRARRRRRLGRAAKALLDKLYAKAPFPIAFRQAAGIALAGGDADAAGSRVAAKGRHWVTTPRSISLRRMRPTIEVDTATPSRRSTGASVRSPHIGLSARRSSTALTNAGVQLGLRTRIGRREHGSARSANGKASPG